MYETFPQRIRTVQNVGLFLCLSLLFFACGEKEDKAEIKFSINRLNVDENSELELSSESESEIIYTLNGLIPKRGTEYTFAYTEPISLRKLAKSTPSVYDSLSYYQGTSELTLYPKWHDPYVFEKPSSSQKSLVVRAKLAVNKKGKVFSRCYDFEDRTYDDWTIHLLPNNPDKLWNTSSGHYTHGKPWQLDASNSPLGLDQLSLANFEIGDLQGKLKQYGVTSPEFRSHLLKLKGQVVFYYRGEFVASSKCTFRVNGGQSKYKPIKGFKVKLKKPIDSIPFAKTGNIYLRKTGSTGTGISNRLANELMNLASSGCELDRISKSTAIGTVSVGTGHSSESFGMYHLLEANDRKLAKKRLGYQTPHKISVDPLGHFAVLKEPLDSSDIEKNLNLIKDTASFFQLNEQDARSYINVENWVQVGFAKSMFRTVDAWYNNASAFHENGKNISPYMKDDDTSFETKVHVNGLNLYPLDSINFLSDYVYGTPFLGAYSRDNWYTWCFRAAMLHPEVKNYSQNLMLDLLHQLSQDKVDSVYNSISEQWLSYWEGNYPIERINGMKDKDFWINDLAEKEQFLNQMRTAFLDDWVQTFRQNLSLSDTFNIHVKMDSIAELNAVSINRTVFKTSGKRLHFKDFKVQVSAIPSDGFEFKHWLEYPDSTITFMLTNETQDDIELTPMFKKVNSD